jgi:threonine synthase
VPAAIGDFLILRAVRESNGFAVAVSDGEIESARSTVSQTEGLLLSPEGAATFAAYRNAIASGQIGRKDRAVLFNCATGLKYPMPKFAGQIDCRSEIDFERFS